MLADEATTLLHGAECLPEIRAAADALFAAKASGGGGGGDSSAALPRVQLSASELSGEGGGQGAPELVELYVRLGFAKSKSEGRRLIQGGGARANGEKIEDVKALVEKGMFSAEGELKLSSGKKKHGIIELLV